MSRLKKRFSAWNLLWIVPLALILALAVMMYVVPAFENVDRTAAAGSADWMKSLADDTPIAEVTLPGTHDSAAQNVQLAYFSKCQALSIAEQLEAGFRYLDIRLGDCDEGFKLMHGFVNCTDGALPWSGALKLDSVLNDCYGFLEEHPSEFIVFCVKHEHGDASDAEFMSKLMAVLGEHSDRWYQGTELPTVGEARGKLVLLHRTEAQPEFGIAFNWRDQGGFEDASLGSEANANASCTVFVQDRFEYDADEKWLAFTSGMENAQPSESTAALNFLSAKGHAKYGHPYGLAVPLNKKLAGLSAERLSGWVIVDFGSAKLAEHIYSGNFD